MEARDGPPPIRPLPPERPEGRPTFDRVPPTRRWLPLAAIGVVGVVIVSLAGLNRSDEPGADVGAGSAPTTTVPAFADGDPSITTTTTTTTTLPATLDQLIPGFEGFIAIAGRIGGTGRLLLWGATASAPQPISLTSRPDMAAFDAAGVWLAYLTEYQRDRGTLHVGLRTETQAPQFLDVSSFAWHPTERGVLAWVARRPLSTTHALYTGIVDEVTGELVAIGEVAEVTDDDRLVAWGEWGFALEHRAAGPLDYQPTPSDEGATIPVMLLTVYDPAGVARTTAPAQLVDATADGTLLVVPYDGYAEAFTDLDASPEEAGYRGTAVIDLGFSTPTLTDTAFTPLPTPSGLTTADGELDLIPDGTRIASVRPTTNDRLSVTTLDVAGRGTRIASVDGPIHLFGFTVDGTYVVAQRTSEGGTSFGDLLLVDWRSGAQFSLPLPGAPDFEVTAIRVE